MRQLISTVFFMLVISACSSFKPITKNVLEIKNYQEVIGKIEENKPKADKYAMYPNGLDGIYEHILNTTRYPNAAFMNNIQGRVVVEFIVEKNGYVKEARIIESVSDELDNEALRVIYSLERFYPGFLNGKPVRILYIQAISFKKK